MSLSSAGLSHAQESLLTWVALGSGGRRFEAALTHVPVQRLLLDLALQPRTAEFVDRALEKTDVSRGALEDLNLLRRRGAQYTLGFTLLTQHDVRRLRSVGERYASSLAAAVLRRRAEIEALIGASPVPRADPRAVAFALVGCFSLDWDGLTLTAEKGYRTTPARSRDGQYIPWAEERGPLSLNAWPDASGHSSLRSVYWGSHSTTVSDVTFTSFGDHASLPRGSLPDVFWPIHAVIRNVELPDSLGPVMLSLAQGSVDVVLDDFGRIMVALRDGPSTVEGMSQRLDLPPARTRELLAALTELQYVGISTSDSYSATVPVFTERDRPLIDSVRALNRSILEDWLSANYYEMEHELSDLTPQRFGIPLRDGFIQVWHYVFGLANRELVEAGWFADPYAIERKHRGFIPFVWTATLR